jgi:hypothetical protein
MIAVPLIVVWVSSQVLYFRLHTVIALVLSIALSFLCAAGAARIWERRSKTTEISFSELMIWSWYRLQKAERRIERNLRSAATTEDRAGQLEVLHGLADALESKDPYTRGHSRRVERHSFKTGVAMGLPLADVEMLRMSASLHDVGKIRIPNTVLHKAGALTEEERALVEEHPVVGASIVAIIGDEQVVEAVRHHHERWDGGGYPAGIAGTEIPLFSRVIAVADTYDAIRSNRSYRTGASRDEAVLVLTNESGHQLDAEVVEAFLSTLPARGRAVAAVTSLATGPGALWRYLAQLFQRFGSTALAPALGAAGAGVIIGVSSILTPGIPAVSAMEEIPGTTDPSGTSAASSAGGVAGMRDRDRILAQARADERLVAAQERAERRSAQRQERRAEQRQERRAEQRQERRVAQREEEAAGAVTSAAGSSGSPTSTTQDPVDSPTTSDGSDIGQGTDGDPNAEGKDCKDGRQPSKGRRLHCG